MNYKTISIAVKKYNRLADRALDWLMASYKNEKEDKKVCRLYYKKYCRLAEELNKTIKLT